jgi:hypothetical protein
MQGRLVRHHSLRAEADFTHSLSLAGLPAGEYVLTLSSAEGKKAVKVVKVPN